MALIPNQGTNVVVAAAQTSVQAAPAGVAGGFIKNPASSTDQGVSAETLYVDCVGTCATTGGSLLARGTIVALEPGDVFEIPEFSQNPIYVNANSSGHNFSCVYFTSTP